VIGNDLGNVFAVIDDKSLFDSDLILSLKGIYLKKIGGIQVVAPYSSVEWDDAEKTRIKIGESVYTNKYFNMEYLVDLCKSYSNMIKTTDEEKLTGCEISDAGFNNLFSKLQQNVINPLSDSVKLMIAES